MSDESKHQAAKLRIDKMDTEALRIIGEAVEALKQRNAELEAENAALREDKARLVEALEEIAEGDGCNCRVGPGCDWKCKDIANMALDAARKGEKG